MNRSAAGVTTRPPQQNHARQIDVIRQPPWVIFLHKYFTRLLLRLPLPRFFFSGPSRVHLFFIGHPNKSRRAGFNSAAWVRLSPVRLGRSIFKLRPRGACLRTKGVGVRDHAGVEWIGQRSVAYKPLPHAPRTAV